MIALIIAPVISIAFRSRNPAGLEFLTVLSVCVLIAFLTAAIGDAWDNVKHMYLFNLLIDAWLISLLRFGTL